MRRTPILAGLGLWLWSATVISGQATLTDAQRAHVKGERFDEITSIRGLPLGVRYELQRLWGTSELEIAEPGAPFQAGAAANSSLPIRRLVTAACAPDQHCLVYYERGGQTRTWLVALFQWSPAATRLETGGIAPAGLKTLDDVRNAVLSGAIKPNGPW